MALANYTDLQASVASWIDRTDQTANIPDFIALAESAMNAELRLRDMVKTGTLATVDGVGYVELPADWLAFTYIRYEGTQLEYVTPDVLRANSWKTGDVAEYSIEGNQLLLNPTPGAITLDIGYYGRIPALSATPTNAILTKYPMIYLSGALAAAFQFLMDDAKADKYQSMYQTARDMAKSTEAAGKISGGPLRVMTR